MSTATKQRQLNLDELRRLKWLLGGAMALVSLWTVFFLDIEALGLVGVASAIVLTVMIWPQVPAKVPGLVWKLSVPAIIVVATVDFYLSPDTLPVLIRLAILLVAYRSVAYRRKREDLQLIVLGMFLIVVAGVLTVSLGFAFLLLLFTAFALGFLFVINLIDAAETSGSTAGESGTAWTRLDGWKFLARMRAVADWRLLGFSLALFTAVVVMSGVLFLIIPRFEIANGFFLDRYITRKSRTGFTENVNFGDVTELARDETVAMRVDVTESTGLVERPYWRMVVLDEYTPQGFKMSADLKAELVRNQGTMQVIKGRSFTPGLHSVGGVWTFYVEPGVSRFLPLPGSFGLLRLRDQSQVQTNPAFRLVALRSESMAMSAFQLESVEQTAQLRDPGFGNLLEAARANAVRTNASRKYNPLINLVVPGGPENQTALRRIVAEIENGAGSELSAEDFVRRAMVWLRLHHSYAMSVKLPAGPGRDDIVRWLDSEEPGYCEYFASGLTVLARASGYPARVITGFRGGVLNAFENYYMVRNSDAHAWVEVFDGKTAWVRFDPTLGAASTVESLAAQAARQDQDSSWSARFDSLRVLWYRRIVNFDSRTQVQMLEQMKTFTTDSGSRLRARFEELSKQIKIWIGRPWDGARLGKTAGLLVGLGAFLWSIALLIRWTWQLGQRWLRPQKFDPVRREAGRWLARLRVHAGPNEIVADLQRLRYGRRENWPEPAAVFKRAKRVRRK